MSFGQKSGGQMSLLKVKFSHSFTQLSSHPSIDVNITGSGLLANWHNHYVWAKWCRPNKGISAVSFCHQLTAWVPDMFCNFYLVKNPKIANSSKTTKGKEKIGADLELLEF